MTGLDCMSCGDPIEGGVVIHVEGVAWHASCRKAYIADRAALRAEVIVISDRPKLRSDGERISDRALAGVLAEIQSWPEQRAAAKAARRAGLEAAS